jgi:hypothetical protein
MRGETVAAKFEVTAKQSPTDTRKNHRKHIIVRLCAWGMKAGLAVFTYT